MIQALEIPGWQKLLILAVLLRILIMPFLFHPDIKTYHFQASFLSKGVLNIYSYLTENKKDLPIKEEFVYFPLSYFFLGGYQTLVSPLLGNGFSSWLSDASQESMDRVGVFRYLFLLKLPYLGFDIAIAFVLALFFNNAKQKRRAFILWLFNPLSIILIYVYSNIDVIPVFLTLLSLLLIEKQKLLLPAVLLGVGAGFKSYPMLFLPFLILLGRSVNQKLLIAAAALGTLLVTILPFLTSTGFQQGAFASGLTTRIFSYGISLGFGEILAPGVIALTILFFWSVFENLCKKEDMWKYFLVIPLLIFSLIHFHIQWILWILPFFVILIVKNQKFAFPVAILLIAAVSVPLLYDDKAMTFSAFKAISSLYVLLPTPFVITQKFYDPYTLQSVLHSLLAGGSLVLTFQIFRRRQIETG